jgi:hypothetical protein
MGERRLQPLRARASEIGVSEITLRRHIRQRILGHHRIGAKIFISDQQVEDYMRRTERSAQPAERRRSRVS